MTESFNGDLPIWQLTVVEMSGTIHQLCGSKAELMQFVDFWVAFRDDPEGEPPEKMVIKGHTNTCDRAEVLLALRPDHIASMNATHYC